MPLCAGYRRRKNMADVSTPAVTSEQTDTLSQAPQFTGKSGNPSELTTRKIWRDKGAAMDGQLLRHEGRMLSTDRLCA